MKKANLSALAAVAVMGLGSAALAQTTADYESGHGALQVFDEAGIEAAPQWVKIWLMIMLGTFAASLLFVWRHPIAILPVAGILASFFLTSKIFDALGLPYLSGAIAIGHIVFWTPALVALLLRRPFLDGSQGVLFRLWSAAMTAVIMFSFVFDIRDAAIYLAHVMG